MDVPEKSSDQPVIKAKLVGSKRRPSGLTALCVIVILAGALAGMSSLTVLVNVVFGERMQQAIANLNKGMGQTGELQDAQTEFNKQMASISRKFRVPNILMGIGLFVLAVALIFGGLGTMRDNATAYRVLCWTMLGACIFELLRVYPTVAMQMEIQPATQILTQASAGAQGNADAQKMATQMTRIMTIVAIVIQVGWTLIKVGLYGFGFMYLRREYIRDRYQDDQDAALA